ncbi:hypothetical protein SUGI_0018550 [Cryptomeria japonica]|nr:hypothetical protein SUGI_0018550 [Cryptomeria japonica]
MEVLIRMEAPVQRMKSTVEAAFKALSLVFNMCVSDYMPCLSFEEIKSQALDLTLAAVDNPSNAVEWALPEMLLQPEIMQKAVEEIDRVVGKDRLVEESDHMKLVYVKACAKEALRLHPMAPFKLPHKSMEDSTVGGYHIPKGSHVILSRVGLGRNPCVWEDPLESFHE